jgi:FGGY-family pentulose kinase
MSKAFLGIDVGTGSVRAGVFDTDGRLLALAKQNIAIWHGARGVVEQSSTDIWAALCGSVRAAIQDAAVDPSKISGIGVAATCSLVVVDGDGAPLAVGPSEDPGRNIIVWMDHRAIDQTRRINATGHEVLKYVGGQISPEMETPKLLWLRENKPETFASAGHFFDLSDYLTWRLTGDLSRSVCTVTCKWTYLAHEKRWDRSYFEAVGLGELAKDFKRIGTRVVEPGTALGNGLAASAAIDLGLIKGIPVGAALIDAHAGGLGTVGAQGADAAEKSLAYIFGTSACALATTRTKTFVPGVWGPYFSSMIPALWLNEAGQSAAGAAIDYLAEMHPAAYEAKAEAAKEGIGLIAWLESRVVAGATEVADVALRARSLHVVPEFNGNRSPFADPEATGILVGLRVDYSIDSLCDLYVAALCGIGYGLGQIISSLQREGILIEQVVVSGGAARSKLVQQILADTTGLTIALPESPEPVLLGAAMLGAVASGHYQSIEAAMEAMSRIASFARPKGGSIEMFHREKAIAYAALQDVERHIRRSQRFSS